AGPWRPRPRLCDESAGRFPDRRGAADAGLVRRLAAARAGAADALGAGAEAVAGAAAGLLGRAQPAVVSLHPARAGLKQRPLGRQVCRRVATRPPAWRLPSRIAPLSPPSRQSPVGPAG